MSHGTLTTMRHLGLCAVLLAASGAAYAAMPDGRWSGVIRSGEDAARAAATRRGEMIQLRFGEPHNCQLPAELLDEDGEAAQFRLKPSPNGGRFCTDLYPGALRVKVVESGMHLSFDRSGRTWSGLLAPSAAP